MCTHLTMNRKCCVSEAAIYSSMCRKDIGSRMYLCVLGWGSVCVRGQGCVCRCKHRSVIVCMTERERERESSQYVTGRRRMQIVRLRCLLERTGGEDDGGEVKDGWRE